MTAPNPILSPIETAHLFSEHLKKFAQFLEVKEKVLAKLEELHSSGRIEKYTHHDRADSVLHVLMTVPYEVYRTTRSDVMWEVRDLGLNTSVLVDAFVTFSDPDSDSHVIDFLELKMGMNI
jgi:hypothetical protein